MSKTLLAIVLGIMMIPSITHAQTNLEDLKSKKEEVKAKIEEKVEQRCTILETNIDTRIARHENNKDRHLQAYQNTKEQVKNLVDRAKEAGYDTSQLETDLQTMDQKIRDFSAAWNTYFELLQKTKEYACGESEGEFRTALKTARDQLRVVRQHAAEIRNFYQTVIRPDIQDLKSQNPA